LLGTCITSSVLGLPTGLKQALQAFDQQDFEKAQITIDQLLEEPQYQQQPSSWYYKGVIYDQLMRKHITSDSAGIYLDRNLEAYRKTLVISHKHTQYHSFANINIERLWAYYLNRGVQYYKVEAFDEALEQFAICQKIYNDHPYMLLYTAIAAHQAEKYETALGYYEKYIKIGSAAPAVYRAFANLTANYLKNTTGAYEMLQNAMNQYPWDINLLEEYYQLLLETNQLANTQQKLQTELAGMPHNPSIYYQLAYLYTQENNHEEAVAHYKKVLELLPRHIETILQLGKSYYNQAAQLTQQMTDMPEEDFQQHGKEILEKMNENLEVSLNYLQQANKLLPNNLEIMKLMHTLYTRLNKGDQADQLVRKIKRIKGGIQLLESI